MARKKAAPMRSPQKRTAAANKSSPAKPSRKKRAPSKSVLNIATTPKQFSMPAAVNIQCKVCSTIVIVHNIIEHIIGHTDIRPYKCGYCGTRLKKKTDFTKHVNHHKAYVKQLMVPEESKKNPKLLMQKIAKVAILAAPEETEPDIGIDGDSSKGSTIEDPAESRDSAVSTPTAEIESDGGDDADDKVGGPSDENSKDSHASSLSTSSDKQTGPIKCSMCTKTFQEPSKFVAHEMICEKLKKEKMQGKKKYVCSQEGCDKKYKYSRQLEDHVRTHTGEKPFQCEECSKAFRTKANLKAHTERHTSAKRYQCTLCDEVVKKSHMRFHQLQHEGKQAGYRCEYCHAQFRLKTVYIRHLRVHTGERPFTCKFCGKTFADLSGVTTHERIHTGERPFTCETCNKTFMRSNHLKDHMATHSTESHFTCSECNGKFKHRKSLQKHMKKHKSDSKSRSKDDSNDEIEIELENLGNEAINSPFHDSEVTVATSAISKPKKPDPFAEYEGFAPPQQIQLYRLKDIKITQDESGKRQRVVSTKPRPFICKVCRSDFTENRYLRAHMRIHTDEKPFSCEFCPEKFRTYNIYKCHRMDHTGDRPFKCKHCSWSFKQRSALVHHERKHTGIRPYKCEYCDKAFTRSTHLRSHYVTHSSSVPFICKECGMKFKYAKTLKRHLKVKHNISLVPAGNLVNPKPGILPEGIGLQDVAPQNEVPPSPPSDSHQSEAPQTEMPSSDLPHSEAPQTMRFYDQPTPSHDHIPTGQLPPHLNQIIRPPQHRPPQKQILTTESSVSGSRIIEQL